MDFDETRAGARAALLDPEAREIRQECLQQLVKGLWTLGDLLRLAGTMIGQRSAPDIHPAPALVGMGYVANTASRLLSGSSVLLADGNRYAASALARQVVETEYLAWAFAEDQEEAGAWLASDRKDRLSRWQPKHIRDRSAGRFRAKDYHQHCETGGHPTPDGCRFLVERGADDQVQGLLVDSLLHGRSTWMYLITAAVAQERAQDHDPVALLGGDTLALTDHTVNGWWEAESFRPFM